MTMLVLVGLQLLDTVIPTHLLAAGDRLVLGEAETDLLERRDALVGHAGLQTVMEALVVSLSLALHPNGQRLVLVVRCRHVAIPVPFAVVAQLLVLLLPTRRVDVELEAEAVQLQNALVGELILLPILALLVLPPGSADPPAELEILGIVGGDLAMAMLALVLDELGVAQLPLLSAFGADPEGLLLGVAHQLGMDLLGLAVLQMRREAGLTLEALVALGTHKELRYEPLLGTAIVGCGCCGRRGMCLLGCCDGRHSTGR